MKLDELFGPSKKAPIKNKIDLTDVPKKPQIDDNILAVSNCIFKNPEHWIYVTDEMKKKYFFIFNRYMSKKYPEQAQFLNDKLLDEIMGMNLIYAFLSKKTYPRWFWSKSEKKAEKISFSQKDLVSLQSRLDIKEPEMDLLVKYYPDEIKEELKYIKALNEEEK